MNPVSFSRQPYKVTYFKDGVKQTIRRVPPPKLHNIMPKDEVILKTKKNADYLAGDEFTVKGINPRQPNTIHLENAEGESTFVSYRDLEVTDSFHFTDEEGNQVPVEEAPGANRYLLWP